MPAGEAANANTEAEPIPDPIEHERVVKLIALGMFTGGLNVYQQLLMQLTRASIERGARNLTLEVRVSNRADSPICRYRSLNHRRRS